MYKNFMIVANAITKSMETLSTRLILDFLSLESNPKDCKFCKSYVMSLTFHLSGVAAISPGMFTVVKVRAMNESILVIIDSPTKNLMTVLAEVWLTIQVTSTHSAATAPKILTIAIISGIEISP